MGILVTGIKVKCIWNGAVLKKGFFKKMLMKNTNKKILKYVNVMLYVKLQLQIEIRLLLCYQK